MDEIAFLEELLVRYRPSALLCESFRSRIGGDK
jgi:hypothetical protein